MPESEISVRYSKVFERQLSKAPETVIDAFRKRRQLFLIDPYHPQLRNHKLRGEYQGMNSINVTGDWRALFTEHIAGSKRFIEFRFLGTHSQLYK